MKLKALILTLVLLGFTSGIQAAISTEGWFYPVIVGGDPTTKYLKGAYSTEEICNEVRTAEYGDGDSILPWEGGPGCHYIYESDIDNANELYNISQPDFPIEILELEMQEIRILINNINDLDEYYNIEVYKSERVQLINDSLGRNK